jgi:hypothetical protein
MKCTFCKKNGHGIAHCWVQDPSRAPDWIQAKIRANEAAKNGDRGGDHGGAASNG